MDKKLKVALSIVLIVFLVSLTVFVNVLIANYSKESDFIGLDRLPTIQVRGEAEVTAVPDLMEVSFSVVTINEESQVAVTMNNEKMKEVVDYLKSAGVTEIKTETFSLNPLYEYLEESNRRVIYSYEVSNVVDVKLRNFEDASYIIDGAIKAGANRVNKFNLLVEDEEKHKEDARKIAIEQAREKAESISDALGLKVGRVVSFSEEGGYYYPSMMRSEAMDAGVPIEPGENKISVSVVVEYEIR